MSHPKPKVAKSKSTLAVALAAALSCLASGMANAALVTGGGVNTLMVTETVAGNSAQTVASVGPLTDSAGYAGQTLSGTASSTASALGVVPVDSTLSNTVYQNNSDAESAVTNYLKSESSSGTGSLLQAIATAVAAAMKPSGNSTGAQMGIFTFIQNVQIANPTGGSPTAAQVYATVSVQPDGQYQFLGTSINNDTLFLLYADYQQAQDAYYLPAGWTVPGAGELQWELLEVTVEGNTINGAPVPVHGQIQHTIQDNGAYDGIVTQGIGGKQRISYTQPVADLMANQIVPLMKQYNATMGVVLYGEQVKAARNTAGQPLTAISVQTRTFTSSCGSGDKLSNTGQYGYLLTETNNEYLVQDNGSYSQAGQIQSNSISPNAKFSESANLPDGSQEGSYENDVVFPIAPYQGQLVNYTSGNPIPASDYTYVAPLQTQNDQAQETTEIDAEDYGWINVCISPNITVYNGAPSSGYVPPDPDPKYGPPTPGYSYYATTDDNITPFTINGVPDPYVCNYNASQHANAGNCALENDTVSYLYTTPSGDGWTDAWENLVITTNGSMPPIGQIQTNYFLPPPSWITSGDYDAGAPTGFSDYQNGQLVQEKPLTPVTLYIQANPSLGNAQYNCTTGGCTLNYYSCEDKYICGY
ncbi:hypothetical protein ACSSZE_10590 [Acidithiobacillus caldus]